MPDAPRILLHNDETDDLADTLRAAMPGATVATCNDYKGLPAQIAAFRPDILYSVRFAGTVGFPRDAIFGPDGPGWVANAGVGTDHFGQWNTARVTVTNAAGVAADMMAEYILGGFLHFTLDVPGLAADQSNRVWAPRTVRPLKGKTLLIIGLGHTGKALASRAKAFGMTVLGTRARPEPVADVDEVYPAGDLPALLPRADAIAVCVPLIPQTRGLLGPSAFAAMKRGVLLADVSRGGVVDGAALSTALRDGTVGGAALDVFETEPLPQDAPLWTAPNTLISPHCSSVYEGWRQASFDLFLDNLRRWRGGHPLRNVVDPVRGY